MLVFYDSFDVINGIRHDTIILKIINRLYIPYIYIFKYIYKTSICKRLLSKTLSFLKKIRSFQEHQVL